MKKLKAFTLIEVMVSIFVFSSAMIGFAAFHIRTISFLLDNDLVHSGNALAFDMVEEINAMSYSGFRQHFTEKALLEKWRDDGDFVGVFGDGFVAGPFNSFGKPSPQADENFRFYRSVRVDKYSKRTIANVQEGTYLSTLYEVTVRVAWPKTQNPAHNCGTGYSSDKCDSVEANLVRSAEDYEKKKE